MKVMDKLWNQIKEGDLLYRLENGDLLRVSKITEGGIAIPDSDRVTDSTIVLEMVQSFDRSKNPDAPVMLQNMLIVRNPIQEQLDQRKIDEALADVAKSKAPLAVVGKGRK